MGEFCPACGQRQRDPRRSLGVVLGELLDELALNARLPTTIRVLLRNPGRLTADWIEGHRASYLSPVRLYILASVVFFTVAFFLGLPFDSELPGIPFISGEVDTDPGALTMDVISARFQGMLTVGVLLVVPLVAVLLFLLHRGSRFFFVDHLVFSLHLHAFTLLVLTLAYVPAALLVGDWGWLGITVAVTLALSPAAYLTVALRRVYGRRGWARVWRFNLVGGVWAFGVITVLAFSLVQAFELQDLANASRSRYVARIMYNRMHDGHMSADTLAARVLGATALGQFERTESVVMEPHDYYHMAELQAAGGDTAAARGSLERLLTDDSTDALALGFAGLLARRQGDLATADSLFDRLLETGVDSLHAGSIHHGDFAGFLEEARRQR